MDQIIDQGRVVTGDARFEEWLPLLRGRRTALFANHTAVVGDRIEPKPDPADDKYPLGRTPDGAPARPGEHVLDAMRRLGVDVRAVFSPEHGFRGSADAGASVADSVDRATGVPIVSLYGGTFGREWMDRFDTLVVDIQDVGLRFYTYYITMIRLMEACAAAGRRVVLLDRPNPTGFIVDGPVLDMAFRSGVGGLPIPTLHGLTLGELAAMANGEGWIAGGPCDLTVIPCQGYRHDMKPGLILRPSPNLRTMRAVWLYATTCLFENTAVSVGRGTPWPFEVYGSPYLTEGAFSFVPRGGDGAAEPPYEGQTCFGEDLRLRPVDEVWAAGVDLEPLVDMYARVRRARPDVPFFGAPDDKGRYWIDKLMGTDQVRRMIGQGAGPADIRATWQADLAAYRRLRANYLIYP